MQSEPSQQSSETVIATSSPSQTQPTQHGLQQHQSETSSRHLYGRGGDGVFPASDASSETDVLSISSSSSNRDRRADLRRLSNRGHSPRGTSTLNRITEYERSRVGTPQRYDEVMFQIVPSKHGAKGASIEDFPNEVLTHLLSHLSPSSLSAMSLVSKRFHDLITTPHAWREAFSRLFPGPDSLLLSNDDPRFLGKDQQIMRSDRRAFTRLSALASWRSEYILRTRLLRSLNRGKPIQHQSIARAGHSRHGGSTQATAVTTYGSGLLYPVSHLHATFGTGLNKKQPLFMHGATEQGIATSSDPALGKVDNWGINDHQAFKHFADLYFGDAEYGLGTGNIIGMPNVMDLSQQHGKIYGEACPGGRVFYTSVGEQRGRFLPIQTSARHDLGIPEVSMNGAAVCAVWIAKSEAVLEMTGGIFGMLAGFSNGVLSAYALGASPVYDRRFEKGEPTAQWVLSPGVPIIAITVDAMYSTRRHAQERLWVVVMNALGEVFYLTELPIRPETKAKLDQEWIEELSWVTGRSVNWSLIEATRRIAKPDPFGTSEIDGSYTPRSSATSLGLSSEQTIAETQEIEKFLSYRPQHFRELCLGWDMRRKLLVDFAGDDHGPAGESITVICCGFEEGQTASIRRFSRRKFKMLRDYDSEPYPAIQPSDKRQSLFGGISATQSDSFTMRSPKSTPRSRTSSQEDVIATTFCTEWYISDFTFGGLRPLEVSATALDESMFSGLSIHEDPLLHMNGGSSFSTPFLSPFDRRQMQSSTRDIPGQRARLMAIGTTNGIVVLWNVRAAVAPASDTVNFITPIRIIYTDSPQISCLALTSLYLVHGGNDGLVQAWDPLASDAQPIRTLNSRFSSRARRRLVQAQASAQGVGNNYYAAGALALDPDPTVLRGMVCLGTHLRYWSYSSSAADQFKSSKRKLRRRSERGSNTAASEQRFTHTGRGALKDYIATEKFEMEQEKVAKRKEQQLLSGRFGTDLLGPGASEEDMLAYATLLSEEAYSTDEIKRRASDDTGSAVTSNSGETLSAAEPSLLHTNDFSSASAVPKNGDGFEVDSDITEAIRLSLLDQADSALVPTTSMSSPRSDSSQALVDHDVHIWRKTRRQHDKSITASPAGRTDDDQTLAQIKEESDLEFALRLSLAEEESRRDGNSKLEESSPYVHVSGLYGDSADDLEFPDLQRKETTGRGSERDGSGKGKGKAAW